jgi:hypothetical protein
MLSADTPVAMLRSGLNNFGGNRRAAAASARGPWPRSLASRAFGGRGVRLESGKAAAATPRSPVPQLTGGAVAKALLNASYDASANIASTLDARAQRSGGDEPAAAARSAQLNAPGAERDALCRSPALRHL